MKIKLLFLLTNIIFLITVITVASKNINHFIENTAQWPSEVKYLTKVCNMNVWITDSGLVYDIYKIEMNKVPVILHNITPIERTEFSSPTIRRHVLRMILEGCGLLSKSQVSFKGINKVEAYNNYFVGNDTSKWACNVPLYKEVIVNDIYKGIDIRYYFEDNNMRYDFNVKPGAELNKIKLKFEGQESLAINYDGELIIKTSLGEIKHTKLKAYQYITDSNNNQIIKSGSQPLCKFIINPDNSISFSVNNYDPGLPLIIDPLIWSTYLGGNGLDEAECMKVDDQGNVFLTGITFSNNFPTNTGAYDSSYNGNYDIFITKLNTLGTKIIFSTYIGGSNDDYGYSIAIDKSGNSYITGYTKSSDFPFTPNAYHTSLHGNRADSYITKLNSSGTALIYSTYLGGSSYDYGKGIVVDSSGFVIIIGYTFSSDFPTTYGALDTILNKGNNTYNDVFVTKINYTGSALIYSTFISGSNMDWGYSIVNDAVGNVYITGKTYSSDFPSSPGAFSINNNGNWDAFITKLNETGTGLIYSTYAGGNAVDDSRAIAIDKNGNAYITGETNSSNFPTTSGCYNTIYNGGSGDCFVLKLNSTGTAIEYSTFLGGDSTDVGNAIIVDNIGKAYVTGQTYGNFPFTDASFDSTLSGVSDSFLTILNPDGSKPLFSTYLGGNRSDNGYSIDINEFQDIYLAGSTSSTNFPVTESVIQDSLSAGSDCFITKINLCNGISKLQAGSKLDFKPNICNSYISDTIIIRNIGFCNLTLDSTYISGNNAAEFSIIFPVSFPIEILPADSSYLIINFAPDKIVENKEAILSIINNSLINPWQVNLTGYKDRIAFSVNNKESDTIVINLGSMCTGTPKDTTITILNKSSVGSTLFIKNTDSLFHITGFEKVIKQNGAPAIMNKNKKKNSNKNKKNKNK
jgi:hypothetical protein